MAGLIETLRPSWIIARREVKDQFRDWRILFPVVALTIFFPGLMNFTAAQAVSFVQRFGAPVIGDRLIPFLLMIVGFFPISVSLVIALESFVGEKERHSIEPLLASPLTDGQLYLGKLAAAMVPPLFASYLGIVVYLVGVYWQIGWTPPPVLLLQILLLTAVQAVLMVSGAVVVSAQTTSVRAANLLASFIIIPMALLIQGESIVMFWGQYEVLWWAVAGQLLIAGLLVRAGVSQFNREELLGRELDVLNLRWGARTFWSSFTGGQRGPRAWLGGELRAVLRRIALPLGVMALSLAAGVWVGAGQARVFVLPEGAVDLQGLNNGAFQGLDLFRFYSLEGVLTVWLHNLRAVALATLLGMFSFGVLGVVVLMLPLMIVGYLLGTLAGLGFDPLTFFNALVLPHGILEIPAMLLAGAVILRLGASLAAPSPGRTTGEAWLMALADWAKIMLALVLPLLLGAAFLEVLVTPRVAIWLLGG